MPTHRITITLDDELFERIEQRKADPQDRSAEIAHTLSHHFGAVALGRRRLAQKLSRAELFSVLDACNGLYWDARILPMMLQGGVLANVADACALDGLHDKWQVDRAHLCTTLQEMTDLEAYALLDLIHELWNRTDDDWDALLADFSAEPATED